MFRVTRNLWQGRFASRQRLPDIQQAGISHLVNVSESPNQLTESDGPFRRVLWLPIEDLAPIPADQGVACLQAIHECVCDSGSSVYIHCVAGWNRSPTILWLYLVACGQDAAVAQRVISEASPDAVPAHPKLIDAALVRKITTFGQSHFLPHPRAIALTPVR